MFYLFATLVRFGSVSITNLMLCNKSVYVVSVCPKLETRCYILLRGWSTSSLIGNIDLNNAMNKNSLERGLLEDSECRCRLNVSWIIPPAQQT